MDQGYQTAKTKNQEEEKVTMKLDRNINPEHKGKYALIKLRGIQDRFTSDGKFASIPLAALDFGSNPDTEFFVIRLKDQFAGPALRAYAHAITEHIATLDIRDPMIKELSEYHHEIIALAEAAHRAPKRIPD
jgi:hypothetical protein